MNSAHSFGVVLVTAPDLKTARLLAKTALQRRLAACVNLVPKIESHYWWRGKLEQSAEVMLVFKTTRAKLPALEKCILGQHPYDTAEYLALLPHAGSSHYLEWITETLE